MSECICGEINARHCPVHSDTPAPPREWWIKNGMAYEYEPDAGSWSFHVVERKALDAALATLESFRKINDDDAHAIYLLTKERDEARAEVERLKKNLESESEILNVVEEAAKRWRGNVDENAKLREENERLRGIAKDHEDDWRRIQDAEAERDRMSKAYDCIKTEYDNYINGRPGEWYIVQLKQERDKYKELLARVLSGKVMKQELEAALGQSESDGK